ncbi:hypothetical protein BH11PSE13_BH11PSE13_32520 [soil metagenome]
MGRASITLARRAPRSGVDLVAETRRAYVVQARYASSTPASARSASTVPSVTIDPRFMR